MHVLRVADGAVAGGEDIDDARQATLLRAQPRSPLISPACWRIRSNTLLSTENLQVLVSQ